MMIRESLKYLICLMYCLISLSGFAGIDELSYKSLEKDGIVSGFRARNGHPLDGLNAISAITQPRYTYVKKHLYRKTELCIGLAVGSQWYFAPIAPLERREIVKHDAGGSRSLCYCPLAGLAINVPGRMSVSGLLKYDTFVLYADATGDLILPYTQKNYQGVRSIRFDPIQLLTYEGILVHFPGAKILDSVYPMGSSPYGNYATSSRQGIGHVKPGLKSKYKSSKFGLHPKEKVLIVGFSGIFQKAYPFSELEKTVGRSGGEFVDQVQGHDVYIQYHPEVKWATAGDEFGNNLNLAYSYMFSLYQNLPDLPVYFY